MGQVAGEQHSDSPPMYFRKRLVLAVFTRVKLVALMLFQFGHVKKDMRVQILHFFLPFEKRVPEFQETSFIRTSLRMVPKGK